MDAELLFERRRAPLDPRRVGFAGGLATLGGVGAFVAAANPVAAAVTAIFGGVFTMVFGLMAADNATRGGRLHRLRRRLRLVVPPAAQGYRDKTPEPDLWVDGEVVSRGRARELVVGHFTSEDFDFWPLYLVFDDRVVELDLFRNQDEALAAQATLAERLELPTRAFPTGAFGSGATTGCLLGAVTVMSQVAAIGAGGIGSLLVEGPGLQVILPTLMIVALWAVSEGSAAVSAKRLRPVIDEEVRAKFGLRGPRARVATNRDNDEVHAEVEASTRSEKERSL